MKYYPLKPGDTCNDCFFRPLPFQKPDHYKPASYRVEQIVKGATIALCMPHLYLYRLCRLKWRLNELSGYRLQDISKWWIR